VLSLEGPLGAGKTTLIKGIAQALGISEVVTSPSFTIMSVYEGRLDLYHIDLYRLPSEEEIDDLGLDDYLYGDGISVIEWGDKAGDLLPPDRIRIDIALGGMGERIITLEGVRL